MLKQKTVDLCYNPTCDTDNELSKTKSVPMKNFLCAAFSRKKCLLFGNLFGIWESEKSSLCQGISR